MPEYSARWYEPLLYIAVTIGFGALAIVVGLSALIAFTMTLMTPLLPRSKNRSIQSVLITALLALVLLSTGISWWLYTSQTAIELKTVSVTIDSETTFSKLSAELDASGILEYPLVFKLAARLRGIDRRLMVGQYDFKETVSAKSILDRFHSGDVSTIMVTIPEGLRVREIAEILSQRFGYGFESTLNTMTNSGALKERYGVISLEGYLFPETYRFALGVALDDALVKMIADANTTLTELRKLHTSKLSNLEILTLASIIEAEATIDSERRIISSVYHNRLRRGMLLQADPTVRFALNMYHRKLFYKDLDIDNAYNTYRYDGLPPGPINSPGRASIAAAFNPAETDFLYFVADGSGGHHFNTNLADHNRDKARIKRKSK
ncbi:endolytic transglycosylase MltG [Gemmatimonas aurantiaca]|nr:endolytic transglycosylase MltG [Gemmatimonas aurantiaca]